MASGNDSSSIPGYPAAYATDYGLAVGAVDQNGNDASFSNRAGTTTIDYVSAPGVGIYSSIPGGGYSYSQGTSMASPHVAGMAALLKSYDKSLTPAQIENLICASASNSDSNSSNSQNENFNMYFSENFDDLFVNNNAPIEGYQNVFDDEATGSDYLNWALDLIGNNNQSIYLSGTEGFYEGKLTDAKEEIDLFVDEINKGVKVEGEEKMFIGGTEGFYEGKLTDAKEEIDLFVDEINKGV